VHVIFILLKTCKFW